MHAYDQCRAKVDWKSGAHHACAEIRASSLSGECDLSQEINRGVFGLMAHHGKCVKRRAALSLALAGRAEPEATVDAVFDRCYADTAPFERHPDFAGPEAEQSDNKGYCAAYSSPDVVTPHALQPPLLRVRDLMGCATAAVPSCPAIAAGAPQSSRSDAQRPRAGRQHGPEAARRGGERIGRFRSLLCFKLRLRLGSKQRSRSRSTADAREPARSVGPPLPGSPRLAARSRPP